MATSESVETLTADEAFRLGEFARACKAATRVVALYPATHPAIQGALRRVAETCERLRTHGDVRLAILPEAVLLDGRAAVKTDSALTELAALLHAHLIGELNVSGELTTSGWHTFLTLLARPADDLRSEGGIERAWLAAGGGPIAIRLIDYRQVLRERTGDFETGWDHIIANYLEGEFSALDDEAMGALLQIAQDLGRFKEFTEQLVTKCSEAGVSVKKDIVLRVLQALADFVARQHPESSIRSSTRSLASSRV
jgi:hypothetical protein